MNFFDNKFKKMVKKVQIKGFLTKNPGLFNKQNNFKGQVRVGISKCQRTVEIAFKCRSFYLKNNEIISIFSKFDADTKMFGKKWII